MRYQQSQPQQPAVPPTPPPHGNRPGPGRPPPNPLHNPPPAGAPYPRVTGAPRPGARTSTATEVAERPKGPTLSVNKVIAAAGAAATTAVLGSFFGAAGTVAGAALGSVVTTVGTTVYHRSLNRTRDTVKARVKLPSGRTVDVTRNPARGSDSSGQITMPMQRSGPDGALRPVPPGGARSTRHLAPSTPVARTLRPRRIAVLAGVTVLVFAIGMLAVTGVEWAKGSPISGGASGTSVGRVLDPAPPRPSDRTSEGTGSPASTGGTRSTEAPTSTTPAEPSTSTTEPGTTDSNRSSSAPEPGTPGDAPEQPPGTRGVLPPVLDGSNG